MAKALTPTQAYMKEIRRLAKLPGRPIPTTADLVKWREWFDNSQSYKTAILRLVADYSTSDADLADVVTRAAAGLATLPDMGNVVWAVMQNRHASPETKRAAAEVREKWHWI
jgi:hypothetical protein